MDEYVLDACWQSNVYVINTHHLPFSGALDVLTLHLHDAEPIARGCRCTKTSTKVLLTCIILTGVDQGVRAQGLFGEDPITEKRPLYCDTYCQDKAAKNFLDIDNLG